MTRKQVDEEIALNNAREEDVWKLVEQHREAYHEAVEHYQKLCDRGAELRRLRDGRAIVQLDPDPVEVAAEHGATPTVDMSEEDTVR